MKKTYLFSLAVPVVLSFFIASLDLAGTTASCDEIDTYPAPVVTVEANSNNVAIYWNEIKDERLNGYKIVVSKNNPSPKYSDDGYLAYITDSTITSYAVDNSSKYYNGDFGSYLTSGESYYFSVTAVYDCGLKAAGNAVLVKYSVDSGGESNLPDLKILSVSKEVSTQNINGSEYQAIAFSVTFKNNSQVDISSSFYVSMECSATGDYPEGFRANRQINAEISPITAGSTAASTIGTYLLEKGSRLNTKCSFYIDRKIPFGEAGDNAISESNENNNSLTKKIYLDSSSSNDESEEGNITAPLVWAESGSSGIHISWTTNSTAGLSGYKIVASKKNSAPAYPKDGYAEYITDSTESSYTLNNSSPYHGGDIGSYFVPGEKYYVSVTAVYNSEMKSGEAALVKYLGPDASDNNKKRKGSDQQLVEIEDKARKLKEDNLEPILTELQELRDVIKEQQNQIKYLQGLISDLSHTTEEMQNAINRFITYGVDDNTKSIGERERAAVVYSYKEAFGKLPETEEDLADAIKIANGRWPGKTSEKAERKARLKFREIYKRIADMGDEKDRAAITVMAYGLRQRAENRSINSEADALNIFSDIFEKMPDTTEEWNTLQAIAYSGAKRGIDSDGDLLTDEMEARYGTDPFNPDTDGDGHSDGVEVDNGYNPLGPGKLVDTMDDDSPYIYSIDPSASTTDVRITIKGKNFGQSQDKSVVSFNGAIGDPAAYWNNEIIRIDVPPDASTGPVIITVSGKSSNAYDFTVEEPLEITLLQANQLLSVMSSASHALEYYQELGDEEAVEKVLKWLNEQEIVEQAYISSNSIFIEMDSGLTGFILLNDYSLH